MTKKSNIVLLEAMTIMSKNKKKQIENEKTN